MTTTLTFHQHDDKLDISDVLIDGQLRGVLALSERGCAPHVQLVFPWPLANLLTLIDMARDERFANDDDPPTYEILADTWVNGNISVAVSMLRDPTVDTLTRLQWITQLCAEFGQEVVMRNVEVLEQRRRS